VFSLVLRAPQSGEVPIPAAPTVQQTRRDYGPAEVLRTTPFWVMYIMFVMVGTGGLMAVAQLGPIAKDYKIDAIPVSILGLTLPALTFALTIDRVLNGVCRPFFGWVSDQIGRENTMFIAFLIEGIGIYALLMVAGNPLLFVILSGLVFFAWGEIYSLFPATSTDLYGRQFATTNYGMLYTAKGTAALLVPLANVLTSATGSWHAVFYISAILNIIAAFMALVVLKPMRVRAMASGMRMMAQHTLVLAGGLLLILVSVGWWLLSYRGDTEALSCLVMTPCETVTSAAQSYLAYRPFLFWIGLGCLASALVVASLRASDGESREPAK
jgi:OFA family oxalate/formate antiporter-like MFS transporter